MHPARIASRVVPGTPRMAPASATSSSAEALREGTGSPSASLWVGAVEVENPIAPASHASVTSCAIVAIWSSVAGSWQASPSTARRTAEWPTRNPALTPTAPSNRPNHSPKLVQSQDSPASSASSGIPSTRAIIRMR